MRALVFSNFPSDVFNRVKSKLEKYGVEVAQVVSPDRSEVSSAASMDIVISFNEFMSSMQTEKHKILAKKYGLPHVKLTTSSSSWGVSLDAIVKAHEKDKPHAAVQAIAAAGGGNVRSIRPRKTLPPPPPSEPLPELEPPVNTRLAFFDESAPHPFEDIKQLRELNKLFEEENTQLSKKVTTLEGLTGHLRVIIEELSADLKKAQEAVVQATTGAQQEVLVAREELETVKRALARSQEQYGTKHKEYESNPAKEYDKKAAAFAAEIEQLRKELTLEKTVSRRTNNENEKLRKECEEARKARTDMECEKDRVEAQLTVARKKTGLKTVENLQEAVNALKVLVRMGLVDRNEAFDRVANFKPQD